MKGPPVTKDTAQHAGPRAAAVRPRLVPCSSPPAPRGWVRGRRVSPRRARRGGLEENGRLRGSFLPAPPDSSGSQRKQGAELERELSGRPASCEAAGKCPWRRPQPRHPALARRLCEQRGEGLGARGSLEPAAIVQVRGGVEARVEARGRSEKRGQVRAWQGSGPRHAW